MLIIYLYIYPKPALKNWLRYLCIPNAIVITDVFLSIYIQLPTEQVHVSNTLPLPSSYLRIIVWRPRCYIDAFLVLFPFFKVCIQKKLCGMLWYIRKPRWNNVIKSSKMKTISIIRLCWYISIRHANCIFKRFKDF